MKQRATAIALDLWQTFFADPVRNNVIRARGGGAAGATTIGLGILAFLVAVFGVVFASHLAGTAIGQDSATLGRDTKPGAPVSIPLFFYPALMSLLLVTVFVGIFGAVYARRTLMTLALVMMALPTLLLAGYAWRWRETIWPAWIGLPAALAIPLIVLLLRRFRVRPARTQAIALVAAIAAVLPTAYGQIAAYTQAGTSGGVALLGASIEQVIALLALLVAPAAVLAGAGAVSFARTVTDFLARSIDRATGRGVFAFLVVFLALLVWRLVAATTSIAAADSTWRVVVKTVVALAVLAGAALWWRWATRSSTQTPEDVDTGASGGAMLVTLISILHATPITIVLTLAFLETSVIGSIHLLSVNSTVSNAVGQAWVGTTWLTVAGVGLIVVSTLRARRGPSALTAWLGVAGAVMVLTVQWNTWFDGRGWGILGPTEFARAALILVTVATLARVADWFRYGGVLPSAAWTRTAFSAIALSAFVAQGDFVDDPFRPLLGFTGIGLVFFGLVWGLLTTGAHAKSAGLAGLGRAAVMVSYAVLTTTLVAWSYATGAALASSAKSEYAAAGKNLLGGTLLVCLLAVWIPRLFRPRRVASGEIDASVDVAPDGAAPEGTATRARVATPDGIAPGVVG